MFCGIDSLLPTRSSMRAATCERSYERTDSSNKRDDGSRVCGASLCDDQFYDSSAFRNGVATIVRRSTGRWIKSAISNGSCFGPRGRSQSCRNVVALRPEGRARCLISTKHQDYRPGTLRQPHLVRRSAVIMPGRLRAPLGSGPQAAPADRILILGRTSGSGI
jgi:hypothetical protein